MSHPVVTSKGPDPPWVATCQVTMGSRAGLPVWGHLATQSNKGSPPQARPQRPACPGASASRPPAQVPAEPGISSAAGGRHRVGSCGLWTQVWGPKLRLLPGALDTDSMLAPTEQGMESMGPGAHPAWPPLTHGPGQVIQPPRRRFLVYRKDSVWKALGLCQARGNQARKVR